MRRKASKCVQTSPKVLYIKTNKWNEMREIVQEVMQKEPFEESLHDPQNEETPFAYNKLA